MNALENIVIQSVDGLLTVSLPKDKNVDIVNRKYYGLSFCTEGQLTFLHDGKRYLSDLEHAVLLPRGATYSFHTEKKGIYPVINFTCSGVPAQELISIPLRSVQSLWKTYEQMKKLHPYPRNRLKVVSLLYDALHKLQDDEAGMGSSIHALLPFIESHIGNPEMNNQMLAQKLGFSETYFRRQFTQSLGVSPHRYILQARLQQAKQLLSDGQLSVTAVAEQCGFSSVYHFSRAFRNRTGLTPTQYIQKHRSFEI